MQINKIIIPTITKHCIFPLLIRMWNQLHIKPNLSQNSLIKLKANQLKLYESNDLLLLPYFICFHVHHEPKYAWDVILQSYCTNGV